MTSVSRKMGTCYRAAGLVTMHSLINFLGSLSVCDMLQSIAYRGLYVLAYPISSKQQYVLCYRTGPSEGCMCISHL